MAHKLSITDLDPAGVELDDDRLARVAGGLPISDPSGKPTVSLNTGRLDGPGTGRLTGGSSVDVPVWW